MNIAFPADLVSIRCFKSRVDENGLQSKVELSSEVLAILNLTAEVDQIQSQKSIFGVSLDLIVSGFHLKSAIVRALLNQEQNLMKTKAIATEVLYQCAATGKINEAIKHFGCQPCSSMFAVVLMNFECDSLVSQQFKELGQQLHADFDQFPIEEIENNDLCTPEKALVISKVFKLSSHELALSRLEDVVMMRLALKDID